MTMPAEIISLDQGSELRRRVDEQHRISEIDLARTERDSEKFRSRLAKFNPAANSVTICAHLDLWNPVLLPAKQRLSLAKDLGLSYGDRQSFVAADLVFQRTDDADQVFLCAVEISWTVKQYDIDRARRNAALLQEALGHPAYAVVYGDRYENDLDWENVHWVRIND